MLIKSILFYYTVLYSNMWRQGCINLQPKTTMSQVGVQMEVLLQIQVIIQTQVQVQTQAQVQTHVQVQTEVLNYSYLATSCMFSVNRSTSFPFPSSPHWAPSTTVTWDGGGWWVVVCGWWVVVARWWVVCGGWWVFVGGFWLMGFSWWVLGCELWWGWDLGCTGWTAILATPQKNRVPDMGEFQDSVFFLHSMSGTRFFWGGGKNSGQPCIIAL